MVLSMDFHDAGNDDRPRPELISGPGADDESDEAQAFHRAHVEELMGLLAIDTDLAGRIVAICRVTGGADLYARYVAVGRTDRLFAGALGVSPDEWAEMMARLRAALPEEIVNRIETPLTDPELPPLGGYRPPVRDADSAGRDTGEAEPDEGVADDAAE